MAKSLLPGGPRITNRAGRDRPRFIRPVERQRMRPWLEEHLDNNDIPGLMWVDKKEQVFKIAWKHAANQCFNLQKDTNLFERWAIHTGRHYQSDHKRWKANFRCALNSLPDVKENKEQGIKKGNNAFKVYRFLDEKDTRGLKETKVKKRSGDTVLRANMGAEDHIPKGQQLTLKVDEKINSSIPILPKLEQLYPTSGVEMLIQADTDQKVESLTDTAEDTNLQEILAAATASLAAGSDPATLENISINQLKRLGEVSRMKLDVRQGVKKNAPGYLYVFLCRWCEKVFSRKIELFQHFLVTHQDQLMAGEEYGDQPAEENSEHQKLLEEIEDLEQKVLGFSEKSYQSSEAGSEDILDDQIAANEVIGTGSDSEEKALDLTVQSKSGKQAWQDTALDLSMSSGRKGKHQKQKQGKQVTKRRRSSQESELSYSVKFGNYGIAGTPRTKRQMSLHTRKKEEEQERLAKKLMSTDGTDPSRQHSIEDIVHAEMLLSLKTGNEDGNDNDSTKSSSKKEGNKKGKKGKMSMKKTVKGIKSEASDNISPGKESNDSDSDEMEVDSSKESGKGASVKAYKCGLCFNKFSTSAMLSRHVESHAGNYLQLCKTCGQEFQSQEELLKHIDSSHSYLYYRCNFCSKVCKTVKKLKNHMWTHILNCIICGEKFYNEDLLDIHLKDVHGVDPKTIAKGHQDETSDESESEEEADKDGNDNMDGGKDSNAPADRTDESDNDHEHDQNNGTDAAEGFADDTDSNSDKGVGDCNDGRMESNKDISEISVKGIMESNVNGVDNWFKGNNEGKNADVDDNGNRGKNGSGDDNDDSGNDDGDSNSANHGNKDDDENKGKDGNGDRGNNGNGDGSGNGGNNGNGYGNGGNNGHGSNGNGGNNGYGNNGSNGNGDGNGNTGNGDGNGNNGNGNGNRSNKVNDNGSDNGDKDDDNEKENEEYKKLESKNMEPSEISIDESIGIDPYSFLNITSSQKSNSEIVNAEKSQTLYGQDNKNGCSEECKIELGVSEVEEISFQKDRISSEQTGFEIQVGRKETCQSNSNNQNESMNHSSMMENEIDQCNSELKHEIDRKNNDHENISKVTDKDTSAVKNEPEDTCTGSVMEKAILLKQKMGTCENGICFICNNSVSMTDIVAHIKEHSVVSLAKVKDALDLLDIKVKALEKPLYMCNLCNVGLDSIQALSLHVSKHLAPEVKAEPSSPKIIIPRRKRKAKLDTDCSKTKNRKTNVSQVPSDKQLKTSPILAIKKEPDKPIKRELSSSCSVLAAYLNAGPLYHSNTVTKALQQHLQGKDKTFSQGTSISKPGISAGILGIPVSKLGISVSKPGTCMGKLGTHSFVPIDGNNQTENKQENGNMELGKDNAEDQKDKTIAESLLQGIWNSSSHPNPSPSVISVNEKGDNTVNTKTPLSAMLLKGTSSNDLKTVGSPLTLKSNTPVQEGRELRIISRGKRGKMKTAVTISSSVDTNFIETVTVSDIRTISHLLSSTTALPVQLMSNVSSLTTTKNNEQSDEKHSKGLTDVASGPENANACNSDENRRLVNAGSSAFKNVLKIGINQDKQSIPHPVYLIGNKTLMENIRQKDMQTSDDLNKISLPLILTSLKPNIDESGIAPVENRNLQSVKTDPVTSSKLVRTDINTFCSKRIDSQSPDIGSIPAKILQSSLPNTITSPVLTSMQGSKSNISSAQGPLHVTSSVSENLPTVSSIERSLPNETVQGSVPIIFSQKVPLHGTSSLHRSLPNAHQQGSLGIISLHRSLAVTQSQTGSVPITSMKGSLPNASPAQGSFPFSSYQGSLPTAPQQVFAPVSSLQKTFTFSSTQQGFLPTVSTLQGSVSISTSPAILRSLSTSSVLGQNLPVSLNPATLQTLQLLTGSQMSIPAGQKQVTILKLPQNMDMLRNQHAVKTINQNHSPVMVTNTTTSFKNPLIMTKDQTALSSSAILQAQTGYPTIPGQVKKEVFLPVINTTSSPLVFIKDSVALSSTGIVKSQTVQSNIPGPDIAGNQTVNTTLIGGTKKTANTANNEIHGKTPIMSNAAILTGLSPLSPTVPMFVNTNSSSVNKQPPGILNIRLSQSPQTQVSTTITRTVGNAEGIVSTQTSTIHDETRKPTFNLVLTQASTTPAMSCPSLASSIFSQITGGQVPKVLSTMMSQDKIQEGIKSTEMLPQAGINQSPNPVQNRLALICSYCKEEIQNLDMITKHVCPNIPTVVASLTSDPINSVYKYSEAKPIMVKKKIIFPCIICETEYKDFEIILSHLREHYGEESESARYCELCCLEFETDVGYGNHMKEYHADRTFVCPICSKDSFDKKSCIEHLENEHKTETRCVTCNDDKMYLKSSELTLHKIFQHPYECMICQYRCDSWSTILYHVLNHAAVKVCEAIRSKNEQNRTGIMCKKCMVGFPSMIAFKSHAKVSHRRESIESLKGESLEMCHLCKFSFIKKEKFHKHIFSSHVKKLSYKCGLCEQVCGKPGVFISHLKDHLNQGLLEVEFCHHCQKVFPRKLLHNQHMLYHASLLSPLTLETSEILTPGTSNAKPDSRTKKSSEELQEPTDDSALTEDTDHTSTTPGFDVNVVEDVSNDSTREVVPKDDDEGELFKCGECEMEGFKTSFQLKQHRVIRHTHPQTRSAPSFYQHVIDNIKKPRYYDCSICGQKLGSIVKLRKHLTMHIKTTSGKFLCSNYGCSLKFKTRLACLNHIKVCKVMKHRFGGEEELGDEKIDDGNKALMKRKTEFVSRFIWGPRLLCKVCAVVFHSRIELKRHLMEVHSDKVTKRKKTDNLISRSVIEDQDLICRETMSFAD